MKTIQLFSILVLAFGLTFSQAKAAPDFKTRMDEILETIDRIMLEADHHVNEIESSYRFMVEKYKKGEFRIIFDGEMPDNIWECTSLGLTDEGIMEYRVGQFLIDNFNEKKAIFSGTLIYDLKTAWNYYQNPEFFVNGMENPFINFTMTMDAYSYEAMFLASYMHNDPSLGDLGEYLINDLEQNQMNGTALLLKQTDLHLVQYMDRLGAEQKSADFLLKEFAKTGRTLLETNTFDHEDRFMNFASLVTLQTYIQFGAQLIFNIATDQGKLAPEEFSLENFPENLAVLHQVEKVVQENYELMQESAEFVEEMANAYR